MFFISKYGHIINVQVKDMGIFQNENEVKKSLENDIRWHEGYWIGTIDIMAKTGESYLFSLKKDLGWFNTAENHYDLAGVALRVIM